MAAAWKQRWGSSSSSDSDFPVARGQSLPYVAIYKFSGLYELRNIDHVPIWDGFTATLSSNPFLVCELRTTHPDWSW